MTSTAEFAVTNTIDNHTPLASHPSNPKLATNNITSIQDVELQKLEELRTILRAKLKAHKQTYIEIIKCDFQIEQGYLHYEEAKRLHAEFFSKTNSEINNYYPEYINTVINLRELGHLQEIDGDFHLDSDYYTKLNFEVKSQLDAQKLAKDANPLNSPTKNNGGDSSAANSPIHQNSPKNHNVHLNQNSSPFKSSEADSTESSSVFRHSGANLNSSTTSPIHNQATESPKSSILLPTSQNSGLPSPSYRGRIYSEGSKTGYSTSKNQPVIPDALSPQELKRTFLNQQNAQNQQNKQTFQNSQKSPQTADPLIHPPHGSPNSLPTQSSPRSNTHSTSSSTSHNRPNNIFTANIVSDKKKWITIHFENGKTNKMPIPGETIHQTLLGIGRLKTYHAKLNTMVLWRMYDEDGTLKPSLDSVRQDELAANYSGQHLKLVTVDPSIRKQMRFNQTKHTWKKLPAWKIKERLRACRHCARIGINDIVRCGQCDTILHKGCKASFCESWDVCNGKDGNPTSPGISRPSVEICQEPSPIDTHVEITSRGSSPGTQSGGNYQLDVSPRNSTATRNSMIDEIDAENGNKSRLTYFFPEHQQLSAQNSNVPEPSEITKNWGDKQLEENRPNGPLIDKTDEDLIDIKEIKWGPEIGSGAYGTVYKCDWFGNVAVKKLNVANPNKEQLQDFHNEIKVLKKTRHDNILLFMGYCHTENHELAIVTAFCESKTLFHHIHLDENSTLSTHDMVKIAKQIAVGMEYLHSKNIIHRDLKSPNVFLHEGHKPKIGDFGLATVKSRWNQQPQAQIGGGKPGQTAGSVLWMSPEICAIKSDNQIDPYSQKSDVYAFGIVLFEMFARKLPYTCHNVQPQAAMIILFKVGKGFLRPNMKEIPDDAPIWIPSEVQKCVDFDREDRPLFRDLVETLSLNLKKMPRLPKAMSDPNLWCGSSGKGDTSFG